MRRIKTIFFRREDDFLTADLRTEAVVQAMVARLMMR
jgi:hypothetical protein